MNDDKTQMVVKCDKNEEPAAKTAPAKPVPEAAAKKKEPSSDMDSSDEEEKPDAKAAPVKPVAELTDEKEESSSEDSSNEDITVGKVSKATKPNPEKHAEKHAAKPAATAARTEESTDRDRPNSDEESAHDEADQAQR